MFVLGEKGVVAKGGGPTASKKVFRVCGARLPEHKCDDHPVLYENRSVIAEAPHVKHRAPNKHNRNSSAVLDENGEHHQAHSGPELWRMLMQDGGWVSRIVQIESDIA